MKTNTHSVSENPEERRFKKGYIKRIVEEKEANQELEHCISYEHENQRQEWLEQGTPKRPA
jgi:ribosome modulation factor